MAVSIDFTKPVETFTFYFLVTVFYHSKVWVQQ